MKYFSKIQRGLDSFIFALVHKRMKQIHEYITRHYYTDRSFSQIMRHFMSYFFAKQQDRCHIHWPFPSSELNNEFNALFDISKVTDIQESYSKVLEYQQAKKCISLPDQAFEKYISIQELFTQQHIELLRSAYIWTKHTPSFDATQLNIAIHIRRGDIEHQHYMDRYTAIDFFIRTIETIYSIHKDARFHIYSDSPIVLTLPHSLQNVHIVYHISEHLMESVHDMIHSNVLVMSMGSNVSQFAGLLSKGLVFFDKRKIVPCFNHMYNIYWSHIPHFLSDESVFLDKLKSLQTSG